MLRLQIPTKGKTIFKSSAANLESDGFIVRTLYNCAKISGLVVIEAHYQCEGLTNFYVAICVFINFILHAKD